jgi:hypothetical protein
MVKVQIAVQEGGARRQRMFHLMTRSFGRGQLKCDGTRAETRFRLSAKRTSLFKSTGASVPSTTGRRGVRISGSNAGYTMFRGSVKGTGYSQHSPVSPFTSPPVRHRVPSHFIWSLRLYTRSSSVGKLGESQFRGRFQARAVSLFIKSNVR